MLNLETIAPKIFVIIPCYNEAAVIRNTVKNVLSHGYSVVVVDDCSNDNSKKELEHLAVYYLRHKVNMGQGASLQTGIDFAKRKGAEYFVTFDADGQHNAGDIAGMFELMRKENADLIFGSRFLPESKTNVSGSRSFVLNIARYVNYFVSGVLLSDAYNGLRLFTKRVAETLRITENKMAHASQFQILAAQYKLRCAEYPNSIHYNAYTKAKGLKNFDGVKIIFEIILYKLFR